MRDVSSKKPSNGYIIIPAALVSFFLSIGSIIYGYGKLNQKVDSLNYQILELKQTYNNILVKLHEIDKKQERLEQHLKFLNTHTKFPPAYNGSGK